MSNLAKCPGEKGLYIDKKTGIFYWVEKIDGVYYKRSTGFSRKSAAKKQVQSFRRSCQNNSFIKRTFSEAFDLALDIKENKSKKTQLEAKNSDRRLRTFLVKKCHFLKNFEQNYEKLWSGYKKATKGNHWHDRKHLCYVLNRARIKRWIDIDFKASMFPIEDAEKNSGRSLSSEEVTTLLGLAKSQGYDDLHDLILVALMTGMRKGEILKLEVEEVDFKNRVICQGSRKIKTRQTRKVPIPIANTVLEIFEERVRKASTNNGTFLFPSANPSTGEYNYSKPREDVPRRPWRAIRDQSGVSCTFKDLRATVATNLVARNINLSWVSNTLGHDMKMLTRIYDKVHVKVQDQVRSALDEEASDWGKLK